ncbi:MAG: Bcr/CflA family multidrug efflux MFS transporter [Aeromonadaceae bacterium]|nr:Bcr/CflA family multidrug efflux MFS transporter [Aeromonadaceae bacterium]
MGKPTLTLFILLGALAGLTPLAIDMYLPAIPTIAQDLGAGVEGVQLTVSLFLGGFALGQLVYGPLADSLGRRPVILFGLALFSLSSLGCLLVTDLNQLLGLRFLQASGGAAGAVVVNALLRDLFSGEDLVRAMSLVILTMTLAPLVAPLLGSLLLVLGWHAIFALLALLALLGALLFIMLYHLVPETLPPEGRRPLRPAVVLGGFADVLRHRLAMGQLLPGILASAGMFAFISGSPYVYIGFFGLSPLEYGLLFALNVGLMMLLTFLNTRLIRRWGQERMLRIGLFGVALASVLLLVVGLTGMGGLMGLVFPVVLYVGQLGFIGANSMSLAMNHFGRSAGTASALAGTLRFGCGALAGWGVEPVAGQLPPAHGRGGWRCAVFVPWGCTSGMAVGGAPRPRRLRLPADAAGGRPPPCCAGPPGSPASRGS